MGIRWVRALLLALAGCGGGGGDGDFARLGGSLSIVSASSIAQAAPFEPEGSVDGVRVLRHVASADGHLGVSIEGADACLHSLDTGLCGTALDVRAGEVVDVVVTGSGAYSVRLDGDGGGEGGVLPDSYWEADPFRARELVAAPAPGFDAAAVAASGGLECLAESPDLCLLRAPEEAGCARTRLRLLLARCARLRAAGLVRFAEPNYERKLQAAPNDPFLDRQWALQQIRVPGLWDEGGASARPLVACVDTGIAAGHPDLAGRVAGGWDFVEDDDDPTDSTEAQSHGTMVAGIAAAATDNGMGVAGVAWGGSVMPLRVFDANGNASLYDIAQAIRYAAGLENSSGQVPPRPAHVVNLSFAGVIRTSSEEEAIAAALDAGTLVVAAVGNDNTSRTRFPAGYAEVLGVGASTIDGARAAYSNRGFQVCVVAPGGTSSDGILVPDRNANGQWVYRQVSGTSFAAPHVSAVAATLMDLGALSPDEARALIESTARDLGADGRDDETGFGLLDAHAAVLALLELPAPAISPGETLHVRLLAADSGEEIARTTTTDAEGFDWMLDRVPAGRYRLVAGSDRDYDGILDEDGELFGAWIGGAELDVQRSDRRLNLSIAVSAR